MKSREDMGNFIRSITTIPLPSGNIPVIDYEVHTLTVYLATYITLREVEVLSAWRGSAVIVVLRLLMHTYYNTYTCVLLHILGLRQSLCSISSFLVASICSMYRYDLNQELS